MGPALGNTQLSVTSHDTDLPSAENEEVALSQPVSGSMHDAKYEQEVAEAPRYINELDLDLERFVKLIYRRFRRKCRKRFTERSTKYRKCTANSSTRYVGLAQARPNYTY